MSTEGNDGGTSEPMSDLESLMWTLESDPFLSSNFANISFFDRAPDHDRLRQRMWRASRVVPRLRRKVQPGLGPLTPNWIDDPDFDLDHHLRWVTLPPGSQDSDVLALAADLALAPLDPNRPLWEFTVIDGLPDGRAAMVQKLHHTITDGNGSIRMSVEFIDLERDAPPPPPVDEGPPAQTPQWGPPALATALLRNADQAVRQFQGRAGSLAGSLTSSVRHPTQLASTLAGLPAESAATIRSLIRQYGVTGSFRSPLWTERSLQRALVVFDVSLEEVKQCARALDGSVNDVFVAAAAGGAGRYHRTHGHDTAELRMTMPVSTRSGRTMAGNAFSPTRVMVPLDADPTDRFRETHQRLTVTKTEKTLGFMSSLAGLAKVVPRPVLVRLARQQVTTVDFTTSNVKAAPFDLYIAGAKMEHNYPIGPIMGTAWNLTTMSYRGRLDIGLHVDTAAVEHPEELATAIQESFQELFALGA